MLSVFCVISVFGAITGSGSVTAGDIAKMYQGVKGKITLDNTSLPLTTTAAEVSSQLDSIAKIYLSSIYFYLFFLLYNTKMYYNVIIKHNQTITC